ncbi:MAG: TetR/AcrR family transcriptional regulator [Gemmatimonadaceae bacterium]|nr:TetR/AcrR family transcriptional regulator [Acetobacteraceae bacterium]
METPPKSRGGRPRSFDREQAIETAMRLFWRHGYEGVSIGDLTDAIGIAAPSLYAAFGSKAGLFVEALARYEASAGSFDPAQLGAASSVEDAVRRLLEGGIQAVTAPDRERGCMISSGMIACHPEHEALARDLSRRRGAMRDAIGLALQQWVGARQAAALARYLTAVMQGISIQARDGATAAELQVIVNEVVAGLAARPAAG